MNNLVFNKIRNVSATSRAVSGIGAVAILAILVVISVGSAQSAGVEQHPTLQASEDGGNGRILLAAKDAKTTDAAEKDAKAKAAAPKGPPPSKFWIVNVLRNNAALTLFLTLALGYYIGGIKLGHFSLGAVTGTLLVGVLIGQLDIAISAQVKHVFFTMFLFAVGYSVGPQFVRGVARDGAPQAIFAVVVCAICLATTYIAAKVAGFDVGLAAGFWAGAQTISASIGLATDAINNSGVSNAKDLLNQIPVAYAICYLWGTIGTGLILSQIGPKLIGTNLVEACKQYEAEMSKGQPEGGMNTAWHQLSMRAFEITAAGKTVADAETLHAKERLYIERIRRDGKIIDFDAGTTLQAGDVVAVSGPTEALMALEQHGKEVADKELPTDMVWVGLFILVAGLIGALSVKIGGVPITLSVSGGVLIGGLVLGWLRSVHPTFGRLPAATQWFMNSVGLNVFIAIVGISAGPGFVAGLKTAGVGLFLWGVVATSVPMLVAPLIGKYVFKFHPAINLGICGGARTSTASVAMVGDVAKSNIPMLGYTVPYAVSNTLLTLIGMIIVLIY